MLNDESTITMARNRLVADAEEVTIGEGRTDPDPVHANDDFDDVFGSAPGSPTLPYNDHEDGYILEGTQKKQGNVEWSDIPRLKEKHETEGYRDGVTKGKAESVQKGFDEGYGLGATLGLRAGKLLGVLEGIYSAILTATNDPANKENEEWETQRERVGRLFEEAKDELKTQSMFGKEWWGEDGIWKFEVPGEKEGREVTFPDVASAHPLVVKWEKVVEEEVDRWGLDLGLMEHETGEKGIGEGAKTKDEPPASMAPGATKELAW
jgi:hypothetical protein